MADQNSEKDPAADAGKDSDAAAGSTAADQKGANPGTWTGSPSRGQPGLIHDGDSAASFTSGSNKVSVPTSTVMRGFALRL